MVLLVTFQNVFSVDGERLKVSKGRIKLALRKLGLDLFHNSEIVWLAEE